MRRRRISWRWRSARLFVLVSASPTQRDRSATDSKAWPTVAPTVAPMTTWTPRFESRAMCYRQSVNRWSDSWGDWSPASSSGAPARWRWPSRSTAPPWTDPAGAVLAVVLVGAVTWAALLAVLWLPSIAASVLVGLCLDAIQLAAHKR